MLKILEIKEITKNVFIITENTGVEDLHNPKADSGEEELIDCKVGSRLYLEQIDIIRYFYPEIEIKINFAT
ncbi:MAG: hypothetical protein EVG15_02705 [Candidatus Acididesulfobacter diazotrophicus]|jgi:hypothetical protein|uniref:Uncharacterized protein n=1 Tax=Candidatus Acididesulfobacter diazotrophicus TaxID=2597226 RepID=A0A519BP31_9DELT|nr:MAG: hypothetical protein EVG15_02705 [Candidatus Acididesulfobacter diazotrophicus]